MAQVMNFHQWPAATTGDIPSYTQTFTLSDETTQTLTREGFAAGTAIDWEHMKASYSGSETDEEKTAVATLMRLCGQAVRMGYGASSGSSTSDCLEAAVRYFGYDEQARWVNRTDCSSEEQWMDLLYDELAQGYPIVFDGHTPSGGHAFVLDGFDGESLFHVNWGWGGSSNGWFLVTSLNPGSSGHTAVSGDAAGYTIGNGVLLGLRKPDADYAGKAGHVSVGNVSVSGEGITARYYNYTGSTLSFTAAIAMLDEASGTWQPVAGTQRFYRNISTNVWNSCTLTLTGLLPQGTYRLSPAMQQSTSTVWQTAYDGVRQYIRATVDAAGTVTLETVTPTVSLTLENASFPAPRCSGKSQQVLMTLRNEGDEFYGRLALYGGFGDTRDYLGSKMTARIPQDGTSLELFTFTPSGTGTFTVCVCSEDGTDVYGTATVEIGSTAVSPEASLAVTDFAIDNADGAGNVYATWLSGTVTVENSAATDFAGYLKLQLYRKVSDTSYTKTSHTTLPVNVKAGSTADVPFRFTGLTVGRSYCVEATYVNWNDGAILTDGEKESISVFTLAKGMVAWDDGGDTEGQAATATMTVPSTACGIYLTGTTVTMLTPNSMPNAIYYVESGATTPTGISDCNLVVDGTAASIAFVDDEAYFVPCDFTATSATYTHTVSAKADGTRWETIVMPFDADAITIGGVAYSLTDTDNPFAIYEFTGIDDNGLPAFSAATRLRANTPYLIAATGGLAGQTIVFSGGNVGFYRMTEAARHLTIGSYALYATTLVNNLTYAYVLNASGTAFEPQTGGDIGALQTYFTTTLSASDRPSSIPLPAVPTLSTVTDDMALVDGVYQIRTGAGLKQFADLVNGTGVSDNANRGASACLLTDIDMSGVTGFKPIGCYYGKGRQIQWYGTFDGRGHCISNLTMTDDNLPTTSDGVALFRYIGSGAVIRNLTIDETCSFSTTRGRAAAFVAYCGYEGLAGSDEVRLENCVNRATVTSTATSTGTNGVGGIMASAYIGGNGFGEIHRVSLMGCINEGNVTGYYRTGGLIGYVNNANLSITVSRCANSGTVQGGQYTAGLLGYTPGTATVLNSYNTGKVAGTSATAALASMLGSTASEMRNCWNTGSVTAGITAHQTLYATSGGTKLDSDTNNYDLSGIDAATLHPAPDGYTAEWLASGQLCYEMNLGARALVYYQNLGHGGDATPVLDASHGVLLRQNLQYTVNGTGRELPVLYDSVYHITTPQDLTDYAAVVNRGVLHASAVLDADLDMSGVTDFTPICDVFSNWASLGYGNWSGTFDGQGHTISGLTVHKVVSGNRKRAALFGNVSGGAVIRNLTLDSTCSFQSDNGEAAGFVGYVGYEGTSDSEEVVLENLTNKADVTSAVAAGGIVALGYTGNLNGEAQHKVITLTLSCCTNSGTITNSASSEAQGYGTGGLIGYGETPTTIMTDCVNSGTVRGTGTSAGTGVGGLVGVSYQTFRLTDCTNTGAISSTQDKTGGLVGRGYGSSVICLTRCANSGTVTGAKSLVGGLVGLTGGGSTNTFDACTNSGTIQGVQSVGGLIGQQNDGTLTITGCNNAQTVTGMGSYVGGLVGNFANNKTGNVLSITDSRNTANVQGTYTVGGLVGRSNAAQAVLDGCTNTDGTVTATGKTGNYSYAGGLVGWGAAQTFTNCGNTSDVTAQGRNAGGIAGVASSAVGQFTNCYNTGNITGSGETAAITGWTGNQTDSRVSNCWNTGTVTGLDGNKTLYRTGSNGTYANNYDLSSSYTAGTALNPAPEGYTSAWLPSGALTYHINNIAGARVYYQTLGEDNLPVPDDAHGTVIVAAISADEAFYANEGVGVVSDMTLTDKADYTAIGDFVAGHLTCDRTIYCGWNSVCMPFAISTDMFGGSASICTLKEVRADAVVLEEIQSVEAGEPCFILAEADCMPFASMTDVTMTAGVSEGGALKGSFTSKTIGAGKYKLTSDGTRLGVTTASGTVAPFRCYVDGDDASAKMLGLTIDGTGIRNLQDTQDSNGACATLEVYDLNGRRVTTKFPKGIYIIGGKKVQTK